MGNIAERELDDIHELEQRFDVELPRPRRLGRPTQSLLNAGTRWSEAIWAAAKSAGPLALQSAEISRGLQLAQQPVFICGAHRSGTTLVRNLLDHHPQLSVLPSEGTFFTDFEARLYRLDPEQGLAFVATQWLRRLANPLNHEPYWVLGRSAAGHSPYVAFARALMAWWPVAQERLGNGISCWPLVAVVLAYAHCTGVLAAGSTVRRWVEKTPLNERFIDRLQAEFPAAKVIQVVRHPSDVYVSRKQVETSWSQRFRNGRHTLEDLRLSYRIALEQSQSNGEHYRLLRYEALLQKPFNEMSRIADFLSIEPLPILMHPTVAGLPATRNSSFALEAAASSLQSVGGERTRVQPNALEQAQIVAKVGESATALGYQLGQPTGWGRLLRFYAR